MTHYVTVSRFDLARRAEIVWILLLVSAITLLPVVILLPLCYAWRGSAYRTVFASHYRSVIRYGWILFVTPLVAALIPVSSAGIAFALVVMFVIMIAALGGRKAASRAVRYNGFFA